MPEIEITIDTEKGTVESVIRGVRGAACENTARRIREVLGTPEADRKTAEYFVAAETRPIASVKGGKR